MTATSEIPVAQVDREALIERIARAMQAVSRPDVDPDKLTPGPRGSVGLRPVWSLYTHMAEAAIGPVIEECAIAARNRMVTQEWPPTDGDQQIDEVLEAIRHLSAPPPPPVDVGEGVDGASD